MNGTSISISETAEECNQPTVIINSDGEYVAANDAALEIHRREEDKLLSMDISEVVSSCGVEVGRKFEKVLRGEYVSPKVGITRGDGTAFVSEPDIEKIEIGSETFVKVEIKEVEQEQTTTENDSGVDLPENAQKIARNIRIDAPGGPMTLAELELDVLASHKKLEQYKQGARSLNQAVAKRLSEEEARNPDSDECKVLRESEKSTYNLLRRLEEGDTDYKQ